MINRKSTGAALSALLLSASPVLAGRPLNINDAPALDDRCVQVEAGVSYSKEPDCDQFDFPLGVTYGIMPGLEAGIGFGGQFEERAETGNENIHESGLGDLTVTAKWNPVRESDCVPALALAPAVKFPTADEDNGLGSGETDYDLMAIASKSIGEVLCLHANVGYSWMGDPEGETLDDVLHYGLAVEVQVHPRVQWVGEVSVQEELTSSAEKPVQYNTGFRWSAMDDLTIDVAAGSSLRGEAPDFTATVGLTWIFGG
ncbi:MAG: transporter [bacterium]